MSDILNCNSNGFIRNRHAIASLLYMVGLSVGMEYGCNGSSSNIDSARNALVNKYGYLTDAVVKRRSSFNDQQNWDNAIKSELRIGHPVIYRGRRTGGGHEFVVDGFKSNGNFHINWGWGGSFDGYFTLHDLSTPNGSYNYSQKAIFNLYPSTVENICYSDVNLSSYYEGFYQNPLFQVFPPYLITPSTMTILKSADESSPEEWRTIPSDAMAEYVAHKEVILQPGFTVERGAEFVARIAPCPKCEDHDILYTIPQGSSNDCPTSEEHSEPIRHNLTQQQDVNQRSMLYPNPTSGEVTMPVDGTVETVTILNTLGQPVGGWKIRNLSTGQVTLDVATLPTGLYLLTAKTTDGKITTGKFTKR